MKAKKSLGQNFLNSPDVVREIIEAGKVSPQDQILEIGPGKGVLTHALLQTGARVVAIEKDDRMIQPLSEIFKNEIQEDRLRVIHGDALYIHARDIFKGDYKLIANIPYYITGEIIRKFFEEEHQPELIVLMVQKEVAERIVTRDGKESILSMSVKIYGTPRYIKTVEAAAFTPQPKVDSAILLIEQISKEFFTDHTISEKDFFTVLKAGFAHKRKLLVNNLQEVSKKEVIENTFEKLGINRKVRPEDLTYNEWQQLITTILSNSYDVGKEKSVG